MKKCESPIIEKITDTKTYQSQHETVMQCCVYSYRSGISTSATFHHPTPAHCASLSTQHVWVLFMISTGN